MKSFIKVVVVTLLMYCCIDLIVSKGGGIHTCQVKKVAGIDHQAKTTLKTCEDGGAYRVSPGGKLSIRQQQNLDWVGYGTLDGKAIVSARQNEVTGTWAEKNFAYSDKKVLPLGYGYFFIDEPIATLNIPREECESEVEQVVESSIKIKITEHQAEKLKEKGLEERRIKTM